MGYRMKKLISIFLIAGLGIFSYSFAAGEVKWFTLREGMEKAKAEKKPIIIDFFFGKGCPRCQFLQREVYDNPAIAGKIMEDFIPIKIDLTKKLTKEEEDLGNKYDYKNDCLLIFLDHNENPIKDPGGQKLCFIDKIDPEEFIGYLETIRARYKK